MDLGTQLHRHSRDQKRQLCTCKRKGIVFGGSGSENRVDDA